MGDERLICARIIERLKGEFARAADLQAILWEQEPLSAHASFQDQIPLPSQTDLVVILLWSRLGHRLHSKFKAANEADAPTGTIFEFRDAVEARRRSENRVPDVLVYRKTAEPPKPSITDRERYLKALDEWQGVEDFFNSDFFRDGSEGAFVGAYHTFKRTADFEETFEGHLRSMIARRLGEEQAGAVTWTKGSPYRGLRAFDFEDRPLFFGRGRAAAEVREALRRQSEAGKAFVLIMGMSGGGKSSLARAGVLPDLVEPGVIEGIGLWRRVVMHPSEGGGDLFAALAEALFRGSAESGVGLPELGEDGMTAAALAERLRAQPEAGALIVEGALRHASALARAAEVAHLQVRRSEFAASGRDDEAREMDRLLGAVTTPRARLALLIDQLEEIFTDPRIDDAARERFIECIAALARSGRVWMIATLRSDFFTRCEDIPALVDLKAGDGTYHLLAPSEGEICQMIRQPAFAAGLSFEQDPDTKESLDDVLLAASTDDAGALPLLEFTLDELYKRASAAGRAVLSRSDYAALGGLEGALATRAEEVLSAMRAADPAAADALPTVLASLARVASGDDGESATVVSRSVRADRFDGVAGAASLVRAMIEARLLTSDRGHVRVAHEALLRHWDRAREWVTENQEFLRVRGRVSDAAARWKAEGESEDFLLPKGKPLVEAEELAAKRHADLSRDELAFIERSSATRRREERAEARRRRVVLTVVSCALLVASVFGVISFWQYTQAQRSAERARHARNEAEKLIEFMGVDLRDKLKPIGRLELLDSANQRVRAYYRSFSDADKDPGILSRQSTALLNEGMILRDRADQAGALKSFEQAHAIRERLARDEPSNTDFQADVAIALDLIGHTLRQQGNLQRALDSYRKSLDIRQQLAPSAPGDARRQRELATSWMNIGDASVSSGDLTSALDAYRRSLAINQQQVAQHPADPEWQHDLVTAHISIGDVLRSQSDVSGARAAFEEGLSIQQKLLEADPRNAVWQRDLAVCLEYLGDVLEAQGDNSGAMAKFEQSLAVHRRLASQDTTNARWQGELFVSYAKVGDALTSRGDTAGALQRFRDGLAIVQALAEQDPTNAGFQRLLAAAEERVGSSLRAVRELAAATEHLERSLAIRRRLVAADATDTDARRDVFVSLVELGDTAMLRQDYAAAVAQYREALATTEALVALDSTNTAWQRDAAEAQYKLGRATDSGGNANAALPLYRAAAAAYQRVCETSPDDLSTRVNTAAAFTHLGRLLSALRAENTTDEYRSALIRARTIITEMEPKQAALSHADRQTFAAVSAELQKLPR